MDTIVTTYEPIDLGAGPSTITRVADSKFKTDPAGNLHVFVDGDAGGAVAVQASLWATVVRGDIAFNNDGHVLLVRRNR